MTTTRKTTRTIIPYRIRGISTISFLFFSLVLYVLSQSLQFLATTTTTTTTTLATTRSLQSEKSVLIEPTILASYDDQGNNYNYKNGKRSSNNNNNNNSNNKNRNKKKNEIIAQKNERSNKVKEKKSTQKIGASSTTTTRSQHQKLKSIEKDVFIQDSSIFSTLQRVLTLAGFSGFQGNAGSGGGGGASASASAGAGAGTSNRQTLPQLQPYFKRYIPSVPIRKARQMDCNENSILDEWDPLRIPGYIEGCPNSTYFGYVMRDLALRLFSYPIPPSSISSDSDIVVVVGSGIDNKTLFQLSQNLSSSSPSDKQNMELAKRKEFRYHVAKSFVLSGLRHGHNVVTLDDNVDTWWSSSSTLMSSSSLSTLTNHDDYDNTNHTAALDDQQQQQRLQQKRILFALFDSSVIGKEDEIMKRASFFLQNAKIKYVVFRVSSSSSSLSSLGEQKMMNGINATRILLDAGYKVQILSASHAHPDGGGNDTRTFPPNTLLKDTDAITAYLQYGSQLARDSEGPLGGIFRSYLFATKGFDLAIPSHREYINVTGHPDDYILDPDDIPYKTCPKSSSDRVVFLNGKLKIRCNGIYLRPIEMEQMRKENNLWLSSTSTSTNHHGDNNTDNDYQSSEAICVKCPKSKKKGGGGEEQESPVACLSRYPAGNITNKIITQQQQQLQLQQPGLPDLVVVNLEKISRKQFQKYFPQTQILFADRYIAFNNHMSIAQNGQQQNPSNHEALFGGGGGGGGGDNDDEFLRTQKNLTTNIIKAEQKRPWIWVVLQRRGYNVLVASNQCVRPSKEEPSNKNTTANITESSTLHGSQINEMFCFDFERPNCLGHVTTAERLLVHAKKFLTYNAANKISSAVFLTLVDGHEDSGLLAGTIDKTLKQFLLSIRTSPQVWSTNILLVSAEGMDYGPSVKSFRGFQESVQPMLYFRIGQYKNDAVLDRNKDMYTTPYDVYETILDLSTPPGSPPSIALSEEDYYSSNETAKRGISLLTPLPDSRRLCNTTNDIPNSHCDALIETEEKEKKFALEMPSPPSISSFFADIPRYHRNHVMTTTGPPTPKRANVTAGCWCTTNVRPWFACKRHPWGAQLSDRMAPTKEYFLLVDCPERPTHFEIEMIPIPALMNKTEKKLSEFPGAVFPNIIFIELDSASVEFADRHFPKTRELLKRYRVTRTSASSPGDGDKDDDDEYSCLSGFCSADFSSHASLAGASSIPNQAAALGGCISMNISLCGINATADLGAICEDPTQFQYGLRLERVRFGTKQTFWCPPRSKETIPKTPWLPAIAERYGYVNYFGEELCFEGSPYVTQGNVFPAFYQDIEPHTVFCRLDEQRMRHENIEMEPQFRWSLEKPEEPCINGFECGMKKNRIALDLLESTWNTYIDRPKLAFLNSGAAHVYTYDQAKQHVLAEFYDDDLSQFIESFLSRSDAEKTVMVIRSDHGLQKGPMAMEYSTQVEHARPWTELLIPESMPGFSKAAMAANQDRLTTSFDLYTTLRGLMEYSVKNNPPVIPTPPIPSWSRNLVSDIIPTERTCQEAKVDINLCREKANQATLGICNALDVGQSKFCQR